MKKILQIILPVLVVALLAGGLFVGCKKKSEGNKKGSIEPPKEEVLPVEDEDTRLAKLYEFTHMPSLGGYQITGVKTKTLDSNLVLPSTYRGEPVVEIGANCFGSHGEINSVEFSNKLISIGQRAFSNCWSLASATIPNSVTTIGDQAFESCGGLELVTIGSGVTSIGEKVFEGCSNLSLNLNYETIGKEFYDPYGNTSIKTVVFGNNVKTIGEYAFCNCTNLTSVTIGERVTSIGMAAFINCSMLTEIVIPNSVTNIGRGAFEGCTGLASVIMGSGVTSIADSAFSGCTGLTEIIIPDGVTNIGWGAFMDCTSLKFVTIGNGVIGIGDQAFWGCTSLMKTTIPNSVSAIGIHAFRNCYNLAEVWNLSSLEIVAGSTSHGGVAYYAVAVYTDASVPSKVSKDANGFLTYADAEKGVYVLVCYEGTETNITLPDSISGQNYVIRDYAFYQNKTIQSVNITNGVIGIGRFVFDDYDELQSISFDSNMDWSALSLSDYTLPYNALTLVVNGTNQATIETALTKLATLDYKSQYTIQIDSSLVGVITNTYGFKEIKAI